VLPQLVALVLQHLPSVRGAASPARGMPGEEGPGQLRCQLLPGCSQDIDGHVAAPPAGG